MLADWLYDHVKGKDLAPIALRLGEVPMPRRLTPDLRDLLGALELPLHSGRIQWAQDDPRKLYFDRVLNDEELTQEQFKLKGMHALFFSKGERRALLMPAELAAESADDELHPGRRKLTLRFELPRGGYATLIVKRITVGGTPVGGTP